MQLTVFDVILVNMPTERKSLSFVQECLSINISPGSDLAPYKVHRYNGAALVKFPIVKQAYEAASYCTKRRRVNILIEALGLLGTTLEDAAGICVDYCFRETKKLPDTLSKYMSPLLQNPRRAAALIAPARFTDRQVQYMRSFFNCLPPVKQIREADSP